MRVRTIWALGLLLAGVASAPAHAQVLEYGDEDRSNFGAYSSDPKAGATLVGLAPNVVTFASNSYTHSFPIVPQAGDFPGTDHIYVGSNQTANHDGYASDSSRIAGPQVFALNYGSLVPTGNTIQTLTLGIAADDFQFPAFGQPYIASVNGVTNNALTNALNSLNQTGPLTQFFTIGIDPAILSNTNVLSVSIDQGGDGGDGWSVDFLTVGVTSTPSAPSTPEPGSVAMLIGMGLTGVGFTARRRLRKARKAA